jgi:hypothetical protein
MAVARAARYDKRKRYAMLQDRFAQLSGSRPPGLRPHARLVSGDSGAVTAEYAIATIAAVGFAALLVVVLRSDEVRGMLTDLIRHALAMPG